MSAELCCASCVWRHACVAGSASIRGGGKKLGPELYPIPTKGRPKHGDPVKERSVAEEPFD